MGSLLSPHSPQTQSIESLFLLVLTIAAVVFLVVAAGVVWTIVRYRWRGGDGEPHQRSGSRALEITWTVVPLLIVTGLFIATVRAMVFIDAPQNSTRQPDLVITGHQWWWEARYPNGAETAADLHLPAARRLLVRIESADVVHDFWAPQLARKMDAVPGRSSYIWLEAATPGTYLGTCSEFCGADHAWMRFRVIAEPAPAFEAWLTRQAEPAPQVAGLAAQGERLFHSKKCDECHATGGVGAPATKGPTLAHLATRESLGAGITPNTRETLTLWLTNPQAAKPGNRMPDTPLTANERDALLAYLEALQ